MKIIVILLTAYMGLLTVEPVLAASLAPAKHSCCANMHHGSKQAKSCCPKGVCSPCQSCCCFVGFKVDKQDFKAVALTVAKQQTPAADDNFLSSFSADYFQPPEVI